jgi:hypothetical protein
VVYDLELELDRKLGDLTVAVAADAMGRERGRGSVRPVSKDARPEPDGIFSCRRILEGQ